MTEKLNLRKAALAFRGRRLWSSTLVSLPGAPPDQKAVSFRALAESAT